MTIYRDRIDDDRTRHIQRIITPAVQFYGGIECVDNAGKLGISAKRNLGEFVRSINPEVFWASALIYRPVACCANTGRTVQINVGGARIGEATMNLQAGQVKAL